MGYMLYNIEFHCDENILDYSDESDTNENCHNIIAQTRNLMK